MEGRRTDRSTNILDEGSYTASASVAGWCNWQHTSLWIWELGFESLPGSFFSHQRGFTDAFPLFATFPGVKQSPTEGIA